MKLSQLMDKDRLDLLIQEDLIKVNYSNDGEYRTLGYTDKAQYTKGSWNNPEVQICRGLIVDSKDNVVARPYSKFFNYGQPEAYVDFNAPVEVTDKIDGCFPSKTRLNLWGGGTITIGEVVKNRLTPTLIGMNADGDLVPSRVTNWFDNGLKDNWLRVGLSTPASSKSGAAGFPNRMFVTPNHHVLHEEKYVPIGSLKVGDSLTSYIKSFSGLDLFLGGLLGDGSVCKNGNGFNYQEGHGESQRKYVEEQRSLFSDGLVRAGDTRGGYADSPKVWLQAQNAQVFEDLRNEWYPEGTKRVPYDLSFMNDAVVAKWFMDDGSRIHSPLQQDRVVFSTNGFVEEDVRRLAAWLEAEYGVTAKVFNSKGWSIRLNYTKGTINKFWEAVAPYTFPSMEYKLPEKYRGRFSGFPSPKMVLLPVKSFITSMEEGVKWHENNYGRARTRAFDIETETHNYMCQGVLVHNSLGISYPAADGLHSIATRGSFLSDQALHATEILRNNYSELNFPEGKTFLFEIVYPANKIVLSYTFDDLVLLGAVDIETGVYHGPLEAKDMLQWTGPVTEVFQYQTLKEALEAPPRPNAEGLVVRYLNVDKQVKIKQEDYLKAHAYLTNCTPLQIWRKVREGYILEDFLQEAPDEFIPLVTQYYTELVANMEDIRRRVNSEWDLLQQSLPEDHSRKQLADAAKDNPHSPALFMLADGKDIEPYLLKKVKPSS